MQKEIITFIQVNSPDGGFLQSVEWRKFQESFGRKTFSISKNNFHANIVEHALPIVGKYFYIPRGPVIPAPALTRINSGGIQSLDSSTALGMTEVVNLAKKENIGWIRFDANNQEILEVISRANLFQNQISDLKIKKAPHDMQPKELFIIDIIESEEKLLSEMKPKTRYNIKLAQKHNVKITIREKHQATCDRSIDEFVRLVKITAERDKINPHPDEYYHKMFEAIPADNLKLYMAEFEGKIIAANVVVFYGKTATYLHGASDNEYRNVMAPYLLQWQAMLDAKKMRCEKYDFGGIKICNMQHETCNKNSWSGITRFKIGFSDNTEPTKFPGSYDIVINPFRYNLYKILQRIKTLF